MEMSQRADEISKEDYRTIVCTFLSTHKFNVVKNDPDVENAVFTQFLRYEEISEEKARYLAIIGASTAQHFYPYHKRETRQAIGIFTAFLGAVDDHGAQFLSGIQQFGQSIVGDTSQTSLLRDYKDLCSQFGNYYTPFCADRILVGTINFVSSTALENESHDFAHLSKAPNFPHYFRSMTGLSEAFAWLLLAEEFCSSARFDLFIQIAPDLMDYTDGLNDLLSFYKEYFLATEETNPICLRAKAEGCDLKKVLHSLCTELERYADRMKEVVSEDPELLRLLDAYLQGSIGLHISQIRYRLHELSLPV
ncbi:hypothetical protein N7468_000789 [Penicillium chermesinum]|uniref:Trichodiene synthase n=1 Tax=Penicillium chermesinum TaxID=63820 RepID=A0A9W9PFD0_9EURO|nr:uncharacterized protein N7468_000789 [Penicillium chermesinum]KAJ5245806.1 hypothetical protein N7468_000789 [Penicillium chermesinum]